jgi:polysaccharide export outer membrane protein
MRINTKVRSVIVLMVVLTQAFPVWASQLEIVEQDKPAAIETQAPVKTEAEVSVAAPEMPALEEGVVAAQAIDAAKTPIAPAVSSVSQSAPKSESTIVRATDEKMPTAQQLGKKVMPMPVSYVAKGTVDEATTYTLGPDDVIEIVVRRHPEFSAIYPINAEGKIQCKFVGDIEIKGLTKTEVKDRIAQILGKYIVAPEVDVTIMEYRSKVIYVIGEVGAPGKYYMKADKISLREAIVQAGLPTLAAAMRRTTLVRPDKKGKPTQKKVDLYALLYEGQLNLDLDMLPGDVVVVPATVFAKLMRIINPVQSTVSSAKDVAGPASYAGY